LSKLAFQERDIFFSLKKVADFLKVQNMGYVFDFNDARAYEIWLADPKNQSTLRLQTQLVLDLLQPSPGETLLDIGCGVGFHLSVFASRKLQVTGVDPSPYMLDNAHKTLGNRADLHRGFAEDLPFDDNEFNYACLITVLEFAENPQKALQEAFRVAKDRVILGILNRYALKGLERRIKGIFTHTIYNRARFFSVGEIKRMAFSLLGEVPIAWGMVCHLPISTSRMARRIQVSPMIQRWPFGAFAAVSVTLTPHFRTWSLPLEFGAKNTISSLAG